MSDESKGVHVLVTTEHRGVFAGILAGGFPSGPVADVELAEARNCLYWSSDCGGVWGLAAKGPGDSCRIGPAVPALRLSGVTAVARCTPEAAERWKGAKAWTGR